MSRQATFNISELEKFTEIVNDSIIPVTYLSIDPGKFNGVNGYDERYQLLFMHVIAAQDMNRFLHAFKKINTCIVEDFRLYAHKAFEQVQSTMETSRVIGRVESWAELLDVKLVKQGASIKKTGYAWLGKKPPSKGSNKNDTMDAHVHFIYWAVLQGKIKAEQLLRDKSDTTSIQKYYD